MPSFISCPKALAGPLRAADIPTISSAAAPIWIGLGLIVFAVLLSALIFRLDQPSIPRLWGMAVTSSLVFMGGINFTWYLAETFPDPDHEMEVKVIDKAGLNTFIATQDRLAHKRRVKAPIYIPTGVFVQSIVFSDANDVLVTGYIWQKYAESRPEEVSRGFTLPEAQSGEITETYRWKDNGEEVVGWRFRVTLRKRFDYSQYPFDRANVWIRLWHQDLHKKCDPASGSRGLQTDEADPAPGVGAGFCLAGVDERE